MKYQFVNSRLSKDERELLNQKMLAVLDDFGVDPSFNREAMFNGYTGIGGLHGLKYVDFDSFHEYTEAKKEIEMGQFFTPPDLCEQVIQSLQPDARHKIVDFTCGSGNFFNYLPNESNAYGCELEPNAYRVAKFLYPEANIIEGDFLHVVFDTKFDMVVGNPPFNLMTPEGISQFVFMKKAAEYLLPGRILCFIAPKTFLEDEYMNQRKRREINDDFNFLCQAIIPDRYFDVGIEIKVLYFQRKGEYVRGGMWYNNNYVPFDAAAIYKEYIEPVQEEIKSNARYKLQSFQSSSYYKKTTRYPNGVVIVPHEMDLIKKYMFHIRSQADLRKKYLERAKEKLHQLETQVKPDEMKWDEWKAKMLKPEEVIKQLRKWIRKQYAPPPKDICLMVKKPYSIKYKAYSKAKAKQQREMTLTEIILRDKPYSGKFSKLINKKKAAYTLQSMPFQKMERVAAIDKFLRGFELRESAPGLFDTPPPIRLNELQFHDMGLALQKRYAILAWQQGSGKSVAGMAWIDYVKPFVRNVFVVAPSLAVQLTWKVRLAKYGYNFTLVEKWSDFARIRPGKIILMSFDMVRILQKHLKDFIKKEAAYSIALLVDESDELTNINSSRTRAMLACFRKAKYKLLTTGTTTRNNINELYPQLELLYNNSSNMLCWSEYTYRPDEKGEVGEMPNDRYGEPFPPWRGHNLFKWCHCPQRTTVFGIQQDTQDVYNAGPLKDLIDKTIITRLFDDIVGKRIYKIKTHQVVQGKEEHRLYAKIIEEFYSIVYNYFASTGNDRKEALLRLIRQITLLIHSTSIPHTFVDYEGLEKPQKFYHILDMIKRWSDEKVAIGTVMIEAAQEYQRFMAFHLPDRPVYYIDGSKSFNQRKKIIAEFQSTENGVLISTQQSLKSSVDIETCNRCIIESLQWNLPKMSQYYFRFIRYNSKEEKEIHFVTYRDTIEQNILALLMSKEKLNEFVKKGELQSRADIMNEYDVDTSILSQIITKEYDHEGKLYLRWGKQSITA